MALPVYPFVSWLARIPIWVSNQVKYHAGLDHIIVRLVDPPAGVCVGNWLSWLMPHKVHWCWAWGTVVRLVFIFVNQSGIKRHIMNSKKDQKIFCFMPKQYLKWHFGNTVTKKKCFVKLCHICVYKKWVVLFYKAEKLKTCWYMPACESAPRYALCPPIAAVLKSLRATCSSRVLISAIAAFRFLQYCLRGIRDQIFLGRMLNRNSLNLTTKDSEKFNFTSEKW